MRIAINGTGVAGPTLAWWLKKYGHEPVLFERASQLRTGGYLIDFWGKGYDIAEKMGIMPKLQEQGYKMNTLHLVNKEGQDIANISTSDLSSSLNDRFISIARGDIASTIFYACENVETHFGTHITSIEQNTNEAIVNLSNGTKESFDLVIGADGLHSHIRSQVFGDDELYEKKLGVYVAAFTLSGYQPRNELDYISHAMPKKHVARVSLRNDKTLFLFTFRSELSRQNPQNTNEQKQLLRSVYENMGWETSSILKHLDDAEDFYFDNVSQIHMDKWSQGRVALVGDAAACASLLAGEGSGLGMIEAYVLAGEIHMAQGNYSLAFANYEKRLQTFLKQKQKAALNMLSLFAAKNHFDIFLATTMLNLSSVPFLSKVMLSSVLKDNLELPEYLT